jgi:hypothetical protein
MDLVLEDRKCKHPDCKQWFRVLPEDKQEYCSKGCGIHNEDELYLKHHKNKKNFLKIKYGAKDAFKTTKIL